MRIFSALFILLLCSCATPPPGAPVDPIKNTDSSDLSRTEAEQRSKRLSAVEYTLSVDISAPGETFTGKSQVRFTLSDNQQPLRLDFFKGKISRLSVNGTVLVADVKKPFWIDLPASALRLGANEVEIDYEQNYSHEGRGLHRFSDPKTKEVYLYSQFETFDANRFMPCFDQPDLRATLKLDVLAPANWSVISTTRENSAKAEGQVKHWDFPLTPKIATYLFSLHAGPYKVWSDSYSGRTLRIFARHEEAAYVPVKEMFAITKQGMKFYDSFFGYPYLFAKYDQLFVPQFNAGAMENVAAVTFTESIVPRSALTRSDRRSLYSVLLHEMAHMWFGDLVTMKWWNDLWLNESFATIMSALSMHDATEFKESWVTFANSKNSAYFEDGLVTTHPIEADIPSVKAGFANFDSITYGKGASVLKQLMTYMGPEKFKAGLQSYISTYAYKNAELDQFIASLQTQSEHDLKSWADRWLRQSGSDELHVNWTCDGTHLRTLEVTSDPDSPARFRPEEIKVALFTGSKGKLKAPTVIALELNQAHKGVSGDWACPAFVYPNYEDLAYSRVSLDQESLNYVQHHLTDIEDPLLRMMLWGDLWRMTQAGQLPVASFAEVAKAELGSERDITILNSVAGVLTGSRVGRRDIMGMWPMNGKEARTRFVDDTSVILLKRLRAASTLDERKFFFDAYVGFASTPKSLAILPKWFNGQELPKTLKLDLDRRWNLTKQMNRFAMPEGVRALEEMKRLDPSERGSRYALVSVAIRPDLNVKREWVERLSAFPPKMNFVEVRTILSQLFPTEQSDLAGHFSEQYYAYLKNHGQAEEEDYVEAFAAGASPLNCSGKESEDFRRFLSEHTGFAPAVTKEMRVILQLDQRCQKLRGT